jgi:hypothetical protein
MLANSLEGFLTLPETVEFICPELDRLLARPARTTRTEARRAPDRLPPKANATDFVLTPQHTSTG